jgi:protein O-GlcNAc transferase
VAPGFDTFAVAMQHHQAGNLRLAEQWMGVPVVSLCGIRPAGRNSAALLSRVGLRDWAVDTPEQYVALAASLAEKTEQLNQLRGELRDRMAKSLCDAVSFTGELENAYRTMWQRWCTTTARFQSS